MLKWLGIFMVCSWFECNWRLSYRNVSYLNFEWLILNVFEIHEMLEFFVRLFVCRDVDIYLDKCESIGLCYNAQRWKINEKTTHSIYSDECYFNPNMLRLHETYNHIGLSRTNWITTYWLYFCVAMLAKMGDEVAPHWPWWRGEERFGKGRQPRQSLIFCCSHVIRPIAFIRINLRISTVHIFANWQFTCEISDIFFSILNGVR